VLGIADAEHAEDAPEAANPIIVPVACAVPNRAAGAPRLSGGLRIRFAPDSRARELYGVEAIDEEYFCNYEVRPDYRETLERSDARVTGVGPDGEVRVVELPRHRYWIATLYQPQRSSRPGAPNPLVRAFVAAAEAFASEKASRGAWP
jgi:CTP synthase (UTP-ammonia lyase)